MRSAAYVVVDGEALPEVPGLRVHRATLERVLKQRGGDQMVKAIRLRLQSTHTTLHIYHVYMYFVSEYVIKIQVNIKTRNLGLECPYIHTGQSGVDSTHPLPLGYQVC